MKKIAFIGLGNMGLPMAKNLLKAGFDVYGYDVSEPAIRAFVDAGGNIGQNVGELVSDVDAVITMLPSSNLVKSVLTGEASALSHAKSGTLFIDASTIDVQSARELSEEAHHRGFEMVDAPVSGGVSGAAAGSLAFMVGGSDEAFARAKEFIEPMAGKIVHAGGSGAGQAAKACNNMLLAISMIGVSEAFNLGKSLGLDEQVFFDIASNASGQCWSLTSYCPVPGPVPTSPANNDYLPGFATNLMLKDLRLAMEAAGQSGAHTPLGQLSHDIYSEMSEQGHGNLDFSGVIKHLRKDL